MSTEASQNNHVNKVVDNVGRNAPDKRGTMTVMDDETYLTTSSVRRWLAEEAALFIAGRIRTPSVAVTAQTPRL